MHHNAGVRQREALALGTTRQQQSAHARSLADADGRHIAIDELHRVVDRQPCRNRTARRIYVQMNVHDLHHVYVQGSFCPILLVHLGGGSIIALKLFIFMFQVPGLSKMYHDTYGACPSDAEKSNLVFE